MTNREPGPISAAARKLWGSCWGRTINLHTARLPPYVTLDEAPDDTPALYHVQAALDAYADDAVKAVWEKLAEKDAIIEDIVGDRDAWKKRAEEAEARLRSLRTAGSRALEALESEDHETCAEAWRELADQYDGVTEEDYTPWDKRNSIYCGTRLVGGWCKRAPLHEGDHACS